MKILVDTNVLIDVIAGREPFFDDSLKIFEFCRREIVEGAIAANSVVNITYILRKQFTLDELRKVLLNLRKIFKIESVDDEKLVAALNDKNFSDFEDCLQTRCAINFHADYIVTRNVKDFVASEIPAVTPAEFREILEEEKFLPTD